MTKSIYSDILSDLLKIAEDFKAGGVGLEQYQREVYAVENKIVSVEEGELRDMLLKHENEMELIAFTTQDKNAISASVDRFEGQLRRWL
jgi:hypothetical protein